MSQSHRRLAKVYAAVQDTDRFTSQTLAETLGLGEDLFLDGRHLSAILGDMLVDKLVKKQGESYEMTPKGRQVLMALEVEPEPAKPMAEISAEDFASQLANVNPPTKKAQLILAAIQQPLPSPVVPYQKDSPVGGSATGKLSFQPKSIKRFEAPDSRVIELPQELELKVPQAPIRPRPERRRVEPRQWNCDVPVAPPTVPDTYDAALTNFNLNYDDDPKKTVGLLAELVLKQRIALQRQDELLRSLYGVLAEYVRP